MDEIRARRLIAEQLGVPPSLVVGTTALADLGADPLDVVALVVHLEKAFGVRIADAEGEACRTVADLLASVRTARPLRREAILSAPSRA